MAENLSAVATIGTGAPNVGAEEAVPSLKRRTGVRETDATRGVGACNTGREKAP